MADTLAGRIGELSRLINNLKANVAVLERFRDDLLRGLHHFGKMDGYELLILPVFTNEVDMTMVWKKLDIKHPIDEEERKEIAFRIKEIAKLGFKWAPGGEDTPHRVSYNFKIKP